MPSREAGPAPFPSLETLTTRLTDLLQCGRPAAGPVTVLARQPNAHMTTFPSEVVTCRTGDGEELRLFCKYAAGHSHNAHGHRGGVAYEAEVYRQVLEPLRAGTARFFGAPVDGATGETWFILQYLDGTVRLNKTPEPGAMAQAARWLGRFHAATSARPAGPPAFLTAYDAGYYLGWARRTAEFAGRLHESFPWLGALCTGFGRVLPLLLPAAPAVIHGEYYPKNVLFRRGEVYPIDWESAAVGPGEIDLASLTEGWPAEVVRRCEDEYRQARWPGGAPASWEETLAAARLYLAFRWLGDRPEWTVHEYNRWRFGALRSAGETVGLLEPDGRANGGEVR